MIRACLAIASILIISLRADADDSRDLNAFFESKVRPLLAEKCFKCHGEGKHKGGLQVNSRAGLLTGGESGPAIVPGEVDQSLLVDAINYDGLEMPPDGKLTATQVDILTSWIRLGAVWPGSDDKALTPREHGLKITDEDRQFWAFQPIRRAAVPNDPGAAWDDSSPIDAFVFRQLRANGLQPSSRASKRILIRRTFLTLIGLPPAPEDVNRFLADQSENAFATVIDDLMARPQYGERWARHWLDLVRFAETHGYERDDAKPHAWRYRDYVIQALNRDIPYDQFIREQLAGDELDEVTHDSIIATGYYRLGVWDDEPDVKPAAVYEELDDIVRTTSEAFLGLTIGCARCHDHKFDPLPQVDYYRMLSFFRNIRQTGKDKSNTHWEMDPDSTFTPLVTRQSIDDWAAKVDAGKKEIDDLRKQLDGKEGDEKKKLEEQIKAIEEEIKSPPYPIALSVRESGPSVRETRILIRGNYLSPSDIVEPAFLSVLGSEKPRIAPARVTGPETKPDPDDYLSILRTMGVARTSGRRRALADWIANSKNPLTARVLVNRLWHYHFGRGIVPTPSDFGRTGQPPSHPELLDWLASDFVEGGWTLKRMHKQILMSKAWQQSSSPVANNEDEAERLARTRTFDPDNSLLWRQNLRRLDAEQIRDSMLAVSGDLNLEAGGPGFYPALSQEVLSSQSRPGNGWGKSDEKQRTRRSIYMFVKRTLGVPMMEAFDQPTPDRPEPRRQTTTIAPQALILLNSDFVEGRSRRFADRLLNDAGKSTQTIVERAFQLAFARPPRADEVEAAVQFIERQQRAISMKPGENDEAAERRALDAFCRLLFNLNEFVYVD